MKKYLKILTIITIIICILCLFELNTYAYVTITKNNLESSINKYVTGQKIVTTTLSNNDEVSIGNESAQEDPISMNITDDTIQLTDSTGTLNVEYLISGENCIFKIDRVISENSTADDFYLSLIAPKMLSIFFVSVTDIQGIKSETALNYYEENMKENSIEVEIDDNQNSNYIEVAKLILEGQKDVETEVYKYEFKGIEDKNNVEYEYTTTLTINLNKVSMLATEDIKDTNQTNTIQDNTIATSDIPQTGTSFIILVIFMLIVSIIIITYLKNKEYRDIE